jgi:catalase-peroxidase
MAVEETLDQLDLIVLAGGAGVELAAKNAGHAVTAPVTPGRMDRKKA